jgi:hypothetical protein
MMEPNPRITEPQTEPALAMARLMATLYHFMAREIVASLGETRGRELIRAAIREFGLHRGRRIRARVDALGLPPTVENLVRYYDLPAARVTETEMTITPGLAREVTRACAFADVWRSFGAESLGQLYCEQDLALAEGYNPAIRATRGGNMLAPGEETCRLEMRLD